MAIINVKLIFTYYKYLLKKKLIVIKKCVQKMSDALIFLFLKKYKGASTR